MRSALENLSGPGKPLSPEPPDAAEIDGLLRSGRARIADAANLDLSLESRFDLAYNGVHALCLAALRRAGYRTRQRYIVFQALPHTLGLGPRSGACWPSPTTCATWLSRRAMWMSKRDLLSACERVSAALEAFP